MRQRGFTLIELLIVVIIIGIFAGVTITIINPKALQNKTNNAVLSAMINKVDYSVKSFIAASGRYPSGSEIVSSLSRDIIEKDVDSCSTLGAVSDECLFSIPRVKTPATCNESGWTGDDSDTDRCFFRYQGGINGEKDRFRIYVKAHGIENKIFVFDSSVDGKIHKCPYNLTDADGFGTCGRAEIAFGDTSPTNGGGGGGGILEILTEYIPIATENTPYLATVLGVGGVPPYTWALTPDSGENPASWNITINQSTQTISGTPLFPDWKQSELIPITVELTDSTGSSVSRRIFLIIFDDDCHGLQFVVHTDEPMFEPYILYPAIGPTGGFFRSNYCRTLGGFNNACTNKDNDWENWGYEYRFNRTDGTLYHQDPNTSEPNKALLKIIDLPELEPTTCGKRVIIRILNGEVTFETTDVSPLFMLSELNDDDIVEYNRIVDYSHEIGDY